jgi:hypothetical protein
MIDEAVDKLIKSIPPTYYKYDGEKVQNLEKEKE